MTDNELHCMNEINVKIKWPIFSNERDGFFIACCKVEDYPDNVIVSMNAVSVNRDDIFSLKGKWAHTEKYGWQFKASVAIPNKAFSKDGLKKYLVDNIKGIGKRKAQTLIDTFGNETEDVFNYHPDKIKECLNVSDKVFMTIINSWNEANKESRYLVELAKLGITGKTAINIFNVYKEECIEKIRKNPYALIEDVARIGFIKADGIAKEMGIKNEDSRRIDAGIIYVLTQLTEFGNVCTERIVFITEAVKTLKVEDALVEKECDYMISENKLISEDGFLYIKKYYFEELNVAKRLNALNKDNGHKRSVSDEIAAETGINYTDEQKSAIDMSICSGIMVLTGGPGTGKTTTVKGIIKANEKMNRTVLCAAPTGRASKRMQEATGHEAFTIHRLLEFNGEGFQRNKDNPLGDSKGKYTLIVDESSMIDISLMSSLLDAIPHNMNVIFVGDVDQLPSVGPGTVLNNIITSGLFPTIKLTKIQRQAEGSDIIKTAHSINSGKIPKLSNPFNDVYSYNVTGQEADTQLAMVIKLFECSLKKYSVMDIQILSPQHNGKLGTDNLNNRIRDIVNKDGEKIPASIGDFRVGDKVMQTRNNYKLGVFNGDIGIIESYDDENKTITVDYNGFAIIYDDVSADDLVLAYACTIHKSQGSEYPVVILPVSTQHFFMLERNLLYTGVTRAKEYLFMITDYKAMGMGISKVNVRKRTSRLNVKLCACA